MAIAETPPAIGHFSWSKLMTYHGCGRKFYYQYILKAGPERTSAALIFGGAIHQAIEQLHEARLSGDILPKMDDLMIAFDAAWREETKNGLPIQFSKGENDASLRVLGQLMLTAYSGHLKEKSDASEVIGIEHEVMFELEAGVPQFKARLDLIERENDILYITDFKTSRSMYSEQKVQDSLPQIVLYAHATMNMMRTLGVRKVVPRFVVLTKGKKPKIQVLEPHASQSDVDRLKTLARETWEAIQKEVWLKRESWQCKTCPFQRRCRSKAG